MPPSETSSWSFNQPVLLKKNRRASSVLVWTLAGSTAFAVGWAFLAPFPDRGRTGQAPTCQWRPRD